MSELLNRLEDLRLDAREIVGFIGRCERAGVANRRGRVGPGMGFVCLAGFLLQRAAYRESASGLWCALECWCAVDRPESVSGASIPCLRNATDEAYRLRLGASITLEDAHGALREARRSAARGILVRDMVNGMEGWWADGSDTRFEARTMFSTRQKRHCTQYLF
jgi:hypothetical protein